MSADHVLMITRESDFYVTERVGEALARRGVTPLRVNSDRYPSSLRLEMSVGADGARDARIAGLPLSRVRALWLRKLGVGPVPEGVPPELARAVQEEMHAHWDALLDLCAGLRMVNDLRAQVLVEGHKLRQLVAARAAGLAVPDSLLTNDPEAARAFAARHGDSVIVKLLCPLSQSMGATGPTVHTQALGPEDLEDLSGLAEGPMLFQPLVRADHELRVAWVEGRVFVGRIPGGDSPDWRRGERGGWEIGALDPDTEAALGRLMRDLGLAYGAVDLIVPPDGPPVFLEVNPSGEWGMLEHYLGLPVSEALADALLMEPA